jgi:hypothetical protein
MVGSAGVDAEDRSNDDSRWVHVSMLYICVGGQANAKNDLPTTSSVETIRWVNSAMPNLILGYGAWVRDSLMAAHALEIPDLVCL